MLRENDRSVCWGYLRGRCLHRQRRVFTRQETLFGRCSSFDQSFRIFLCEASHALARPACICICIPIQYRSSHSPAITLTHQNHLSHSLEIFPGILVNRQLHNHNPPFPPFGTFALPNQPIQSPSLSLCQLPREPFRHPKLFATFRNQENSRSQTGNPRFQFQSLSSFKLHL